jgi:hypothetical protein
MLTLKIESVDDIKRALNQVGRLPRIQRVKVLEHAKRKLLAIRRRGTNPELQALWLTLDRKLADEKRRAREEAVPKPEPKPILVDKNISDLEVNECTKGTGRYEGLRVCKDKDGFFAEGPYGRTPSYSWSGKISLEELEAIGPHEDISG